MARKKAITTLFDLDALTAKPGPLQITRPDGIEELPRRIRLLKVLLASYVNTPGWVPPSREQAIASITEKINKYKSKQNSNGTNRGTQRGIYQYQIEGTARQPWAGHDDESGPWRGGAS